MTEKQPESFFRIKPLDEYVNSENKNEFIYKELVNSSNLIEGIDLGGEICHIGDIEDFLASDHIKAYKHVIDNYHQPVTAKEILNLHFILMNNIFRLQKRGLAGEYRKNKTRIGPEYGLKKGGVYYNAIPKAMNNLERDIIKLDLGSVMIDNILKIHNDFEVIHPFNDGNGRTGRLILNWLSLKYLDEFTIIDSWNKKEYHKNIDLNRPVYQEEHPEIKFYKNKVVKRPIDPWLLESPFDYKK